jgi:hypothetical protein
MEDKTKGNRQKAAGNREQLEGEYGLIGTARNSLEMAMKHFEELAADNVRLWGLLKSPPENKELSYLREENKGLHANLTEIRRIRNERAEKLEAELAKVLTNVGGKKYAEDYIQQLNTTPGWAMTPADLEHVNCRCIPTGHGKTAEGLAMTATLESLESRLVLIGGRVLGVPPAVAEEIDKLRDQVSQAERLLNDYAGALGEHQIPQPQDEPAPPPAPENITGR